NFLFRVEGPILVGDIIHVGPERLARRFLKTVDAFLGLGLHHLGISKVDPASGHDRTRESPSDWNTPADHQPFGRESFKNAGFRPHAIAVWPAPLRPISRR